MTTWCRRVAGAKLERMKKLMMPTAFASAGALLVYASLVSMFFATVMPYVGELIEKAPRLGWLAFLAVWLAPSFGAAAVHRTAHGILDTMDRGRVSRNATSVWAGFIAWVTIIFVSTTTSFVMLVIDPPPVDPDFTVIRALADVDFLHRGLSSWKPVVHLAVWILLATGVYSLERAARRDV
jgi:hypothetical protein